MARVSCWVYDVSRGKMKASSLETLGTQIDFVPHTGIVVHWPTGATEYTFGRGLMVTDPGKGMPYTKIEEIDLGTTAITEAELMDHLASIHKQYTDATYDLVNHSCTHFCCMLSRYLGVEPPPSRIMNMLDALYATPQGEALRIRSVEQFKAMQSFPAPPGSHYFESNSLVKNNDAALAKLASIEKDYGPIGKASGLEECGL